MLVASYLNGANIKIGRFGRWCRGRSGQLIVHYGLVTRCATRCGNKCVWVDKNIDLFKCYLAVSKIFKETTWP